MGTLRVVLTVLSLVVGLVELMVEQKAALMAFVKAVLMADMTASSLVVR